VDQLYPPANNAQHSHPLPLCFPLPHAPSVTTQRSARPHMPPPLPPQKTTRRLSTAAADPPKSPNGQVPAAAASSAPGAAGEGGCEDECEICYDHTANVSLEPCAHVMCLQCAMKLAMKSAEVPLCPFCRAAIGKYASKA
jgi:hypothetical protein